jgi:hypothetical protein
MARQADEASASGDAQQPDAFSLLHAAHPTGEQSPNKANANMSQRRTLSRRAATMLLAFAGLESAAQPTAAPIRRIDHIMIRADDPAKVYAFFTEILRLPVAWPLMSPREGVATGGVGFGNVNVEAIRSPGRRANRRGRNCSDLDSSPHRWRHRLSN